MPLSDHLLDGEQPIEPLFLPSVKGSFPLPPKDFSSAKDMISPCRATEKTHVLRICKISFQDSRQSMKPSSPYAVNSGKADLQRME